MRKMTSTTGIIIILVMVIGVFFLQRNFPLFAPDTPQVKQVPTSRIQFSDGSLPRKAHKQEQAQPTGADHSVTRIAPRGASVSPWDTELSEDSLAQEEFANLVPEEDYEDEQLLREIATMEENEAIVEEFEIDSEEPEEPDELTKAEAAEIEADSLIPERGEEFLSTLLNQADEEKN